jgi:Mitochondrial protein up-regulated during meiosis
MVRKNPGPLTPSPSPLASSSSGSGHGIGYRSEQLVVRWRTIGKTRGRAGPGEQADKTTESGRSGGKGGDDDKEFTGLFIFEFDEDGRILTHTIEHVQEGGNWEKGVGARVVGLTDWLLGGLKGKGEGEGQGTPCPAFWHVERQQRRKEGLWNCNWK